MNKFSVTLPLTGEYLTTVRLTVGGLCAVADFDVDSAEDFKVCTTESLLILKRSGFLKATIDFTIGETLACKISGLILENEREESLDDEISYALLNALVGESASFVKDEQGRVLSIAFEG